MHRKRHITVTEIFFKDGYEEVHKWLDATYRPWIGFSHWIKRHHVEAITAKYGEDSVEYKVAFLHIMSDFLSHLGLFIVPKSKEECREILNELMLI